MAVIWYAVVTQAVRRGWNSPEQWLEGIRGCPHPVLSTEWQQWCHFTPWLHFTYQQIVFSVLSPPPSLAHVVQRCAALLADGGAWRFGVARWWWGGSGCWVPRFLLAEGGRRWQRGLAAPLLPSPSPGAQLQPAPPNLETARFTSIHESVTSARFCASLQQAAGLCGWNFLLFCNTSFFFFAFHLFKTRKWSIT